LSFGFIDEAVFDFRVCLYFSALVFSVIAFISEAFVDF